MLTDTQKQNLSKLDTNTLLEIMHECEEILGIVSVENYSQIMHMNKRTVYDKIQHGKLKVFELDKCKFPIING